MEIKEHQPSMNIDEQIENLKAVGLVIENEDYARQILNDISYFRLIKAYGLGLKKKNGNFDGKVSFEQIVELYLFNANFRQLLFATPEIFISMNLMLMQKAQQFIIFQNGTIRYIIRLFRFLRMIQYLLYLSET